MLAKTIEVVSGTDQFPNEDSVICEGGIQLFKRAPLGIIFDPVGKLSNSTFGHIVLCWQSNT